MLLTLMVMGNVSTFAAGAQSIAYYAGESSAFSFAAAQADSVSNCLLKASTSVNSNVQVSHINCLLYARLASQTQLHVHLDLYSPIFATSHLVYFCLWVDFVPDDYSACQSVSQELDSHKQHTFHSFRCCMTGARNSSGLRGCTSSRTGICSSPATRRQCCSCRYHSHCNSHCHCQLQWCHLHCHRQ